MSKARVLYIESGSGYGGSASGLFNIVPKLAQEGFDPVVGYYHRGHHIQAFEESGIPLSRIRPWSIAGDVSRLLRRHRIKLAHFNNELYSHVPGILAATAHGTHRICHMRGVRRFVRREHAVKRLIDHYIAISDTGYEVYREEGIPADRMRRIYNSLDLSPYAHLPPRDELRASLGLDRGTLAVGLVSRVIPEKGHREFLQAAESVLRHRRDVTFLIVGGDLTPGERFMSELRQWVLDHGLTSRIRFLGWRRDIPQVTSCLDLAVQSSKCVEGLGRSLLEAMALSLPVVATRTGGFTEVVEDGVTGVLVPVGNGAALGRAILEVLSDPKRRQSMGALGRRRLDAMFGVRVQIRNLAALFDDVLARKVKRW